MRISKAQNQAYTWIKGKIQTGEWPAPTKINEQDVSDELDISRSPVRQAMKQLAAEGFLEIQPYKGAFVRKKPLDKNEFVERLQAFDLLVNHSLFQMENKRGSVDQQQLANRLAEIHRLTNKDEAIVQLVKWMEQLFANLENHYLVSLIERTLLDILQAEVQAGVVKLEELVQDFIRLFDQMLGHLEQRDYPKTRREVRVAINRLMLEVIDQQW